MRKPRMIREDGLYHVVARANRQEFIFSSDEIKNMFLKVMLRAKRRFRFRVSNFCVMSNHFHIMITPGKGESLSKIMQWILSVFAIQFNKRFGYQGHVWYDRFKSKILNGLSDFLHTFRYITENPVRAGIVKKPWDYDFNGIVFIRKKDYRVVEEPDPVIRLLEPLFCEPFLLI